MKIEDHRQDNKCTMFKDLEVGRVFEHVGLNMIMIKLDDTKQTNINKNALRIDDADVTLGGSSTSVELWHISPESKVIPVNAKLIIEE